ncbi:MAG: DUF2797 domain-containing protein [Methylococcaceae bacterium]
MTKKGQPLDMLACLHKMHTHLMNPVQYSLVFNGENIALNPLLNTQISLKHTGRILCVHCKKQTKKSYNQGYCYPCFARLAQCDLCIMKPETCHHAQGTCRDNTWALDFCFQPHKVYLANSSGIKVGITREPQLLTRWMDQGAVQGLAIIKTSSRYIAGLCEIILAQHVKDKTNWQAMLKAQPEKIDLLAKRDELLSICSDELQQLIKRFGENAIELLQEKPIDIHFPIEQYPKKITAHNLDKTPLVSGVLQGIKGQYLLLDTGVLNARKYAGYEIKLTITP